ncbi:copper chaperone PCu(A)C [Variovorax ureilyticus]|uniref:Copper chaperone PCu(A)C n=1 Tax=Variovorax ureilyticus TaxID=1836198 RepID=A0ABU8VD16_9BURK
MNTSMNASFPLRRLAACIVFAWTGSAFAHVSLPPGGATAGSEYEAAFRVGHACQGAKSTTGITVRLPKGFAFTDAQARKGWKLEAPPAGDNGGEVRWKAENAQAALPTGERAEFVLRGKLPATPGVLWFKVLQDCDTGSSDWAQVPASGTSTAGLDSPAARLDVLAAGVAPVDVRDAWIRASVPGQSGTGAFMKLSAPSGARLVGASTPAAGVAEVHEMKMEGDTMRMRGLPSLELPARQTVEFKPGGYHLMLMDLKQPLVNGTSVPLTLLFEDAKGQRSSLELKVPVQTASGAAAAGEHKH